MLPLRSCTLRAVALSKPSSNPLHASIGFPFSSSSAMRASASLLHASGSRPIKTVLESLACQHWLSFLFEQCYACFRFAPARFGQLPYQNRPRIPCMPACRDSLTVLALLVAYVHYIACILCGQIGIFCGKLVLGFLFLESEVLI